MVEADAMVEADTMVGYQPFSLYKELRLRLKRSLTYSRTASPLVKIDILFDILLFNGGLKQKGIPSRRSVAFNITR